MRSVRLRFMALVLAVLTLLSAACVPAAAQDYDVRKMTGEEAAAVLYGMGLFRGRGTLPDGSPDFRLGGTLTRAEAVVLLARLMCAEDEALSGRWEHPFADTGWADKYIGWAYANGVTAGIGGNLFGSDMEIPRNQFVTLVIRALGRTDADWRNPYAVADVCGLWYGDVSSPFIRGDAALMMVSALKLVSGMEAIVDGEPPLAAFPGIRHEPVADGGDVSSPEAFIDAAGEAALSLTDEVRFSVPHGQAEVYVKAFQKAIRESRSSPAPNFESYSGAMSAAGDWVLLRFRYCDDARIMRWLEGIDGDIPDEDRETYELAYSAWRSLAKPGMDEYELVKAFHDWIVDNCEYDSAEGPYCRDAYGVFKLGKAVCDGYAKAMNLLCYFSGIESVRVMGWATDANGSGNSGFHAWNKIRVDGDWYNLDATWDDPVGAKPALRHKYFLVSDADMAETHTWEQSYSFWPTSPRGWS